MSSAKEETKQGTNLGEANYAPFAHRYAASAATKAHNCHYDRPNTLSLVPDDLNGKRVLDAGCGPGFYAEELVKRGATLTAVDATPAFVTMTKEKVPSATVSQVDLTQGLPFADESFDVVLCALVFDYIEDAGALFREFRRVLTDGGLIIASFGHPFADWQYIKKRQPENAKSYFETLLFTTEWKGYGEPKPMISSYRRPLGAYLNPIADANLFLDKFLEARPAESMKDLFPNEYERMNIEPGFLVLRLKKLP